MDKELKNITTLLQQEFGFDISKYDDSFLQKSLESRLSITGSNSLNEYCDILKSSEGEGATFLDSLNINFSEFFRNPLTFIYLEQIILPALIKKKERNNESEIRIWSAACASGQEAYSLAILCDELMERSKTKVIFRIFGSDISGEEITKAQLGVFPATSINNVTLKRVNAYFTKNTDTYTISPRLREYIDFSIFDLLSTTGNCPPASIYGNFDLVFCSNLLFYFKSEYWQQIIEKTRSCQANGGYLLTSESEREIVKGCNYREVFSNSGIFRKK
jgi:chemotaxis protein methyltransferase CheR